jgi:hypothetical protein
VAYLDSVRNDPVTYAVATLGGRTISQGMCWLPCHCNNSRPRGLPQGLGERVFALLQLPKASAGIRVAYWKDKQLSVALPHNAFCSALGHQMQTYYTQGP